MVIATIAILAALLVPSIQRARESANASLCLYNLRKVATGLHGYLRDHDEVTLPYFEDQTGRRTVRGPDGQRYKDILRKTIERGHPPKLILEPADSICIQNGVGGYDLTVLVRGPWTQIHEEPAWTPAADPGARASQPQIAPKWISDDGTSFWLVWTALGVGREWR